MEHVGFHFLTTIYTKLQVLESYPEDQVGGGRGGGGGHANDTNVRDLPTRLASDLLLPPLFS